MAFLLEADRLKGIERQSLVLGGERRENSAEHSWHLALFALVLAGHSDEAIDVGRVITMLLLHDIVEIDAGDTYIYDTVALEDQDLREQAAADRLFGLLPAEQGASLRAFWDEFEAAETADARFAKATDRLQPLLLNHASNGHSWRSNGITSDRVRATHSKIQFVSAALGVVARGLIDDAVVRGMLEP